MGTTTRVLAAIHVMDIGGQGHRIREAFRDDPDWEWRSMVRNPAYMAYPTDLPYRKADLEAHYQACDVFHARVNFGLYDQLARKFGPKPVILHGHGSAFRADPNRYVREARARNAQIVVSTLDLWLLAPNDAIWLPAPYDVDALEAM